MPEGREVEKRPDGSQARVASTDAITTAMFQVFQERTNDGRIEILDRQLRGRLAAALMEEGEELAEGVAVGGHRVRAGLALLGQPVGEERLQSRSQ